MICLDYQPLAIRQMSDAYTIDGLQQHAVILKNCTAMLCTIQQTDYCSYCFTKVLSAWRVL